MNGAFWKFRTRLGNGGKVYISDRRRRNEEGGVATARIRLAFGDKWPWVTGGTQFIFYGSPFYIVFDLKNLLILSLCIVVPWPLIPVVILSLLLSRRPMLAQAAFAEVAVQPAGRNVAVFRCYFQGCQAVERRSEWMVFVMGQCGHILAYGALTRWIMPITFCSSTDLRLNGQGSS